MTEAVIWVYLGMVGLSLFVTLIGLFNDYEIEGVDSFWDWIIYNVFWIILPIKAIIKLFRNL